MGSQGNDSLETSAQFITLYYGPADPQYPIGSHFDNDGLRRFNDRLARWSGKLAGGPICRCG
jgi:hypothetical protein